MKNLVFCIYNNLSNRYGDVFMSPTVGMAQKQVSILAKNPNSGFELKENELCEIGNFDIETGVLEAKASPVRHPWSIQKPLETKASTLTKDEISEIF